MSEETSTPTVEPTRRLKESEWLVIASMWERGETTLKELSANFKISEAALSQGLKRRGIKRGAKAHILAKEIAAKHQDEQAKYIEEVYNFKKKFLRYGEFLMGTTVNLLTEAKREDKKYFSVKNEISTIVEATKVYKTIRNDMFHLYDLYNPDNKPDDDLTFNIGVYSESDIKALREAQEIEAKLRPADIDEDDEEIEGQEIDLEDEEEHP